MRGNRRSPATQPACTRRAVGTTRLNGLFHTPWQQEANQVAGTLSLTSPTSAYKTKTGGSKRKQSTTAQSTTGTTKPTRVARPVNPHRDRPRPPELPIQATRRSPRGISKRSKATKTTSPTTASDGRRRRRTHRRPTTNRRQTTGRHTVLPASLGGALLLHAGADELLLHGEGRRGTRRGARGGTEGPGHTH